MAKCKFTGIDPLHFKTYDCTAAAKTADGYCQRHEFSLNRTLDLIKRVGELEAENAELLDKPCSMCGQDERIAKIGKRLGFRPDVGALKIRRLEDKQATLITGLREMAEDWQERFKHYGNSMQGAEHATMTILADELTALLDKEGNSDE